MAALFPRIEAPALWSVAYELMSGLMLFGGIFLINDPVTSPKRSLPQMLYGLLTGFACMIFRRLGRFEESLLFALLVMNSVVWLMDLLGEKIARTIRRKNVHEKSSEEVPADTL